jgi:glycosyltransferase involved in cell wall biosynthesis
VLREADVFVLPSQQEGLPLSLLEAMASGVGVIVTPVGGIGRVVVDGQNGLLVPPCDVGALSCALVRMVTNESERVRLGMAARETSLGYSWRAVWEKYSTLMEVA